MKGPISRKEFLATTTKSVAAVSAGVVGVSVMSSKSQAATPATWPWPYVTLDTEDVRKRGHKAYYDGGCCYGAFNAITSALAEQVGEPYASIPSQMMYYGGGGGAGWGTLCGALNGAAAAISLFVDRSNASAIVGELFGWYTQSKFPSDVSNTYGQAGVFLDRRNLKVLAQNASGSPLCHISVSAWCGISGAKASSADRAERCARLTGDVAAQVVQYVNSFKAGAFKATFVPARSVSSCLGCHDSAMGDVISTVKMDCQMCHTENWDHLY